MNIHIVYSPHSFVKMHKEQRGEVEAPRCSMRSIITLLDSVNIVDESLRHTQRIRSWHHMHERSLVNFFRCSLEVYELGPDLPVDIGVRELSCEVSGNVQVIREMLKYPVLSPGIAEVFDCLLFVQTCDCHPDFSDVLRIIPWIVSVFDEISLRAQRFESGISSVEVPDTQGFNDPLLILRSSSRRIESVILTRFLDQRRDFPVIRCEVFSMPVGMADLDGVRIRIAIVNSAGEYTGPDIPSGVSCDPDTPGIEQEPGP